MQWLNTWQIKLVNKSILSLLNFVGMSLVRAFKFLIILPTSFLLVFLKLNVQLNYLCLALICVCVCVCVYVCVCVCVCVCVGGREILLPLSNFVPLTSSSLQKLEPETKLDKRNKTTSKFDNYVMSGNCDVIVIFPINSRFVAIQKPDFGWIVCKTYILINNNPLSYKNWKQN